MDENENNNDQLFTQPNTTDFHGTSTAIPHFIPRRPPVVNMEDHNPATRTQLTKEYFDEYDPWMGVRIAVTIGLLVSFFTFYLIYKSRVNKSKTSLLPPKKTSLYLYEEDSGSMNSSCQSSTLRMEFPYKNTIMERTALNFEDTFQFEEVFIKPADGDRVVFKAHPSVKRNSKSGLQFGTLHITEDKARNPRFWPYKPQETVLENTDVKTIHLLPASLDPNSSSGNLMPFEILNTNDKPEKLVDKNTKNPQPTQKPSKRATKLTLEKSNS